MSKAKIIFINEGYAKKTNNGWIVNSSNCLIKSEGKYILCDPGCNRQLLENSLSEHNISETDIDFVFLSHNHIDHILLAGIFSNATIISYENYLYKNDNLLEIEKDFITKDIRRIMTPGHCEEHYSLIIDTDDGKYCFAGDVFWCIDGEDCKDIMKSDTLVKDEIAFEKLVNSRKFLLENSDIIIPGHGEIFKVQYYN